MKVYVVLKGEYSDRSVLFVTDKEEVAKKYCDNHSQDSFYGQPWYETYDTSEITLDWIEETEDVLWTRFSYDGGKRGLTELRSGCWHSDDCEKSWDFTPIEKPKTNVSIGKNGEVFVTVAGYSMDDSPEKILHIAKDVLMKWLAEKELL